MNRRGFLRMLGVGGAVLAAPAIVRASSLMQVKAFAANPFDFGKLQYETLDVRIMDVDAIREMRQIAKAVGIRPIMIEGRPHYVVVTDITDRAAAPAA